MAYRFLDLFLYRINPYPGYGMPDAFAATQTRREKPKIVMCTSNFTAVSKNRVLAPLEALHQNATITRLLLDKRARAFLFLSLSRFLHNSHEIVRQAKPTDSDMGESFDLRASGATTGEESFHAIPLDPKIEEKIMEDLVMTVNKHKDGLSKTESSIL